VSGLVYSGKVSIGVIVPTGLTAAVDIDATLGLILPKIAVDLSGAVTLSAMISITPPNLALDLAAVIQLLADMNIALSASLPQVSFQLTAILALIAEIGPIVASISASLSLSLPLASLFATAGIQAYSFDGTGGEFGSLVTQELANGWPDGTPATANVQGYVLAATANPTWVGMKTFFTQIPPSQPTDSFDYIGSVSIGGFCGLLGDGILKANLNLDLQLGALSAQLQAALNIKAALTLSPPTLSGSIAIVGALKATLNGYLSLGGYISVAGAFSAVASIVADLTALEASLNANLSAMIAIQTSMATAGVLAFTYNGPTNQLGPALTTALAGGWPDSTPASSPANALVLGATSQITATGLAAFLSGI
jgi:hypothetical protein